MGYKICLNLGLFLSLGVGIAMVRSGSLAPATYLFFAIMGIIFYRPLEALMGSFAMMNLANASLYNIAEINNLPTENEKQGITQFTAPWELTKRELAAVTDGRDMQWICYGRIPLMVSAQCIFRNIKACLKNSGKAMVKVFAGEKGRRYIVRNCCKYCYNIIYREEPFQIPCSMEREFWEEVHQVRFEFTTETAEEVHAVLKDEIIRDHCRGHFDAGIQ